MKTLTVEWRHLDKEGDTCERCGDTGAAVRGVVAELGDELQSAGVKIVFSETRLDPARIAESNLVLINGVPVEQWLSGTTSETPCASCSDLLGVATCCRTVEIAGVTHEAVPADMIRRAVRTAAGIS